ncbi:F-box domain, Leucine-rich repeat domain, L domain-like protein [Artemisia annua]|uniref:F-box domain, Leucine-rich repeat domain, L domain-like protein n=1 Tax=Artemisia annua TaxID=35608 RepID=A0A2U1M683_ARTAN|nr:F-box domain, Leucine-rich repeat domain, L domain-like protein [Artemisia annua]
MNLGPNLDIEFPLSLFSSLTHKHLNFQRGYCHRGRKWRDSVTLTSTWEVPALITLHLNEIILSHDNADNFSGLISKCVNLKNLTFTRCEMVGSNNIDFSIFHPQLSNLTIEREPWNARSLSVVAPRLKNLIIRRRTNSLKGIMISAPDLAYLLLQGYDCLKFSTDDFHSLEKADISISEPYKEDPQNIVGLFQLLHSVKNLTLNLEILEHSPLANLKSIKIYPLLIYKCQLPRKMLNMYTEVKNYLLDGSPGATFTMVSREERLAERNVTLFKKRMAKLKVRLEQEKADIESNRAHIEQKNVPMESCNALMDDEQNALDENELQIEGNVALSIAVGRV